MYKRPYEALQYLGNEIVYIDEITGEKSSGIVVKKERLNDTAVMVYIASPYDDENIHDEGDGIRYKEIFMFDSVPNDINGWGRDAVLKEYGKYIGEE